MKLSLLILTGCLIACILLILRKKKSIKNNKKLSLLRKSAETKQQQLLLFLGNHIDVYYQQESIAAIKECVEVYREIIKGIGEVEKLFSSENIAKEVNSAISHAKEQAGFYIDFGLQEELARTMCKSQGKLFGLVTKTELVLQAVKVKVYWFEHLFEGLLPPYKSDPELIVLVQSFLLDELALYEFAKSCKKIKNLKKKFVNYAVN
jgi:hypothetical protein